MPITLAHPMAVLPLRRSPIPLSALVIGSMVPDLPLFTNAIAPTGSLGSYELTHSLRGLAVFDLPVGLGMLVLWVFVVRAPFVDITPEIVRRRLAEAQPLGLRAWALAPVGVLIGGITHIVWDSFTHPQRWGEQHFPVLGTFHAGLRLTEWLQYASGLVGMAVLAIVIWRYVAVLPVRDVVAEPLLPRWTLAAASGGALVVGSSAAARSYDFIDAAGNGVVCSGVATVPIGCLVVGFWWCLRVRSRFATGR